MDREKIEDVLIKIGMPTHFKGFTYIADVMEIFEEIGTKDLVLSKDVYPEVAKRNCTSDRNVEKAIRHAFLTVRDKLKADYDTVNHYIGFANCTSFNSLVHLYLMLKREEKDDRK